MTEGDGRQDGHKPETSSSDAGETATTSPGTGMQTVSLAFDPAKYKEHVDDLNITEEKKLAFLQTLWSIMAAFVDLGFRVDSVTQILCAFAQASSNEESDALKQGPDESKNCGGKFSNAALPDGVKHEP